MTVAPALGIGLLVVGIIAFGLGYFITNSVLELYANRKKGPPYNYYGITRRYPLPGAWTEDQIEKASAVGGGVCVMLAIILIVLMPIEWRNLLFIILTVVGIIGGLATFALRARSK